MGQSEKWSTSFCYIKWSSKWQTSSYRFFFFFWYLNPGKLTWAGVTTLGLVSFTGSTRDTRRFSLLAFFLLEVTRIGVTIGWFNFFVLPVVIGVLWQGRVCGVWQERGDGGVSDIGGGVLGSISSIKSCKNGLGGSSPATVAVGDLNKSPDLSHDIGLISLSGGDTSSSFEFFSEAGSFDAGGGRGRFKLLWSHLVTSALLGGDLVGVTTTSLLLAADSISVFIMTFPSSSENLSPCVSSVWSLRNVNILQWLRPRDEDGGSASFSPSGRFWFSWTCIFAVSLRWKIRRGNTVTSPTMIQMVLKYMI